MIEIRDELWCAWFVGFVDGEGSFQVQWSGGRSNLYPHLQIALRNDDRALVNEIQEVLGIGRIYEVSKKADRRAGKNAVDQVMWRCRDLGEIHRVLIPMFDTYQLRSKKRFEYPIWRQACFVKKQFGFCGDLVGLKKQLMYARTAEIDERAAFSNHVEKSRHKQQRLL